MAGGSGFKNFASGAIATEADFDDYLMRQTVMVFATAAARDAALVGGIIGEVMLAYTLDAGTVWVYNGSAWKPVSHTDSTVSAGGTIHHTGGLSATPAGGTQKNETRNGKHCEFWLYHINSGSAGPAGGELIITLPYSTPLTAGTSIGVGTVYDASAPTTYRGLAVVSSSTEFKMFTLDSTGQGALGAFDFTAALANNDIVTAHVSYITD